MILINKRTLKGIIGGALGFLVGIIGGGYIGLVIGGNLLGGLELHKYVGIEGYAITAYAGAIIGAISATILGVYIALKKEDKNL